MLDIKSKLIEWVIVLVLFLIVLNSIVLGGGIMILIYNLFILP